MRRRIPEIIRNLLDNPRKLPDHVRYCIEDLRAEISRGRLRVLREIVADREDWDRAAAPHVGRRWLDLPWYFAEAFFYRRLLEATGYFRAGPFHRCDPFGAQKAAELLAERGPRRCARALEEAPSSTMERLRALILASLWGNRADLSHSQATRLLATGEESFAQLVVDDSDLVAKVLMSPACREVTIIADNSGTELLMDLALSDHLLEACGVDRVVIHLKNHPFFVSDAIDEDVENGISSLESGGQATAKLGDRLRRWESGGRLSFVTHPFYTSSLFYPQMPADLRNQLEGADLVIVKGDANYRRLCSDLAWPSETPFSVVV